MFLRVTFRDSPLVPSAQDTSLEHTHPMSTSSHSSPWTRWSLLHTHKFRVFCRNPTVLWSASAGPTTYSVSDSIVTFTPAPTPRSHCSLSHAHKFMGFFRNPASLWSASASPTTYGVSDSIVAFTPARVSDSIVVFTPAPTPRSRCSLSHTHKFMGFFRNPTSLWAPPASPMTYSVSDSIVVFTKSYKTVLITINVPITLFPLSLLFLVRLVGYTANLCVFYFDRLIGKLTAFLQIQEFN